VDDPLDSICDPTMISEPMIKKLFDQLFVLKVLMTMMASWSVPLQHSNNGSMTM